jgi:hypothetical protein
MPHRNLTIRVPLPIYEELKRRSVKYHRSFSNEALWLLELAILATPEPVEAKP